jgi:hypothetical protein
VLRVRLTRAVVGRVAVEGVHAERAAHLADAEAEAAVAVEFQGAVQTHLVAFANLVSADPVA